MKKCMKECTCNEKQEKDKTIATRNTAQKRNNQLINNKRFPHTHDEAITTTTIYPSVKTDAFPRSLLFYVLYWT